MKSTALASSFFLSHHGLTLANDLLNNGETPHLIDLVELDTNADVETLIEFYGRKMKLKVVESGRNTVKFKVGHSQLVFNKTSEEIAPFYHFAFNIPENKIKEAESWHSSISEFIEPPNHLNDPEYKSSNIVHFRHWDAHSLFFFDPAGNVVEYIARHTLNNPSKKNFSPNDFQCISEIGLVVNDVLNTSENLVENMGIEQYYGSSKNFSALGDENGLIILFKESSLGAFGMGQPRKTFKTSIKINSQTQLRAWESNSYPFKIHK